MFDSNEFTGSNQLASLSEYAGPLSKKNAVSIDALSQIGDRCSYILDDDSTSR